MTVEGLKGIAGITPREAERSKNFFALGLMSWLYNRPTDGTLGFIEQKFGKRPEIAQANATAFKAGYAYGETSEDFAVSYEIAPAPMPPGTYRQISGNTALAYGLIAASKLSGLDLFLGAYPITPASSILEELARHKAFGVRTFQAEDEIAAVGAALGAAFGGSLGVSTSAGPGIVLKQETIGLGITLELPLLILDIQRAGPSTGMPTKPEQADLLMVLFGRNGESPVPVLAASTPSQCFHAAIEAARIALKYRTPVYLLSRRVPRERLGAVAAAGRRDAAGHLDVVRDRRGGLPAVRARSGDARAAVGDPRHARARAPDRRAREGRRHRLDLLRPREPRPDDAAARREGGGDRERHPAARGRRPGRRDDARARLGLDLRADRRCGQARAPRRVARSRRRTSTI